MALADIDRVGARVVWLIGARTGTYEFAVDDDRYDATEISQAIVETEGELVTDFCESNHPQRVQFISWVTVAHGGQIPQHIGQIEGVKIIQESGKKLAEPTTATNIKLWRQNYNGHFTGECPDSLEGYYCITNGILEYVGTTAEVGICTYTPNLPSGPLQIESIWESALIAGTIPRLAKLGIGADLVMHYMTQYEKIRQVIRTGILMTPDITQAQKIDR